MCKLFPDVAMSKKMGGKIVNQYFAPKLNVFFPGPHPVGENMT